MCWADGWTNEDYDLNSVASQILDNAPEDGRRRDD